jgi:hypothetical protein
MEGGNYFTEQRQHKRASVQNLVVGILNSEEPESIGTITDISLGGVKFTNNELRMAPNDRPIRTIDLIADSYYLIDIPCGYAWKTRLEGESDSKLIELRQCGIQFGRLTPNQIFLLRSLINHCSSLGIKNISSKVNLTYS